VLTCLLFTFNTEPTPSEDTVSIRTHRLHIVRQYDTTVKRILEVMLGRISKLLDSDVVLRESVSCYYPEYSGIDPGLPGVSQEAHSEEASVKENVREAEGDNTSAALYQQQRQVICFVALLFLFFHCRAGSICPIWEGFCVWVVSI